MREWLGAVEQMGELVPPKCVDSGPVMENVVKGGKVDLAALPASKRDNNDGGPCTGMGRLVIMCNPDEGRVNLGVYWNMLHDAKTVGFYVSSARSRLEYMLQSRKNLGHLFEL